MKDERNRPFLHSTINQVGDEALGKAKAWVAEVQRAIQSIAL